MAREFRFGVGIQATKSRAALTETARHFEDLGFDVLNLPDHLGAAAPFPALVAAAQATTTMRVGTYVLNAGFYKPALLARDIADVDLLSDRRLELGLGAGYVREEFEAAELPFPSARSRVDYLEHVTKYIRGHLAGVPVLIAGSGDRVMTLAARYADIVGLTGADVGKGAADPLAERIDFVRVAAGDRFDGLELNIAITASPTDASGVPDLRMTRRFAPELTDEQLLATPGVLSGTPRDIADRLRSLRDSYGVSYLTVQNRHAEYFGKVIAELR